MTVTAVRKDPTAHRMTLEAEFDASPERVWQLWADPRQLERWWGPPTYPATFTRHDLAPGSRVEYHMTGPEGDQPHGYWDVLETDPPHRLVVRDGFANDDGTPNDALPRNEVRVTIEPIAGGRTRMSIASTFPSAEAMEQLLAMGMEQGLTDAVGQIDAMLADETTTHTIEAPGATLSYDVRPGGASGTPPLFLIGSPMGAAGFVTLASHFPDRTVIRYDPRGADRSTKADPSSESNPDQHADDLHRIIEEVGGPVDLFASSGGAVNALALVATHPEDVRTLIAHEPPLASMLPDSRNAKAAVRAISDSYQRGGFGVGMAHFMAITGHHGPFPDGIAEQAGPDPTMFGLPTEDDGNRTDVMLAQNIINMTHYEPDFDALRAAPTRIVIGAGTASEGEMANRGAHAVAERLGTETVVFPSHHGGFLGGEYGWPGEPDAFAAKLREVLDQR
ncbi:MAG TPA: alpha/beta fold hydrolase [Candidatus Limnocylindrales bacterium]|nr:alpha/beta fold hydrolase [Candidatus Limnocylindrales bacterium]